MSTIPASFDAPKSSASPVCTCAKLAVAGIAVTAFWVFTFFVIIPALSGS